MVYFQLDTDNLYTYPKTVCLSCKLNIEEFFTFVQEIRSVDAKLHNQLAKYNKITYDSSIKTSSTTKNNRSFQCSLCPKSYSKYKILEMHTKRHTSLYCFTCNQKFNDLPSHNAHICKSGATLTKINSDHLFDRNLTMNNKTESDGSASLIGMLNIEIALIFFYVIFYSIDSKSKCFDNDLSKKCIDMEIF